jgi:hypothetical protein
MCCWDDASFKHDVQAFMRRQHLTACGLARLAGLSHNALYPWLRDGAGERRAGLDVAARLAVACDLDLGAYVRG